MTNWCGGPWSAEPRTIGAAIRGGNSWAKSIALAVLLGTGLSCHRAAPPGAADLPPLPPSSDRTFEDVLPRWAHDGKRIAFLRRSSDRRTRLYVATADLATLTPVQLAEIVSPDRPLPRGRTGYRAPAAPAWSADDRSIAFARGAWFGFEDGERLPGTELWRYDLSSGRARPLAIHPTRYEGALYYFRSPHWSPDGRRVAFVAEGIYGETALYVRPLAGVEPTTARPRFDPYADVDFPVWSPRGDLLAFRQGVLRAETADRVETVRFLMPGGAGAGTLASWTAAEARAADPEAQEEVPTSPRVCGLAWSPDGAMLAVALSTDARDPRRCAVWVVAVEGRQAPRRISPPDRRGYAAPVWIDGRTLGALRPSARGVEAVAIGLEDGAVRTLCELPGDDIDWSPDRRYIVCAPPAKRRPAASTTLRVFSTGL